MPVIPIATPMSAVFRAGRVVDAVAGHCDDGALPLERLHDPQLVFRIDTGIDGHVPDRLSQRVVRGIRSSSAPVTARPSVGDAEVRGDDRRLSSDDRP